MAAKFTLGHHGKGLRNWMYSYIYNSARRPVIRYWFSDIGRLGNQREFNAEFLSGETIICCHGGYARALVRFLNGDELDPYVRSILYDGQRTLAKLNKLRSGQ